MLVNIADLKIFKVTAIRFPESAGCDFFSFYHHGIEVGTDLHGFEGCRPLQSSGIQEGIDSALAIQLQESIRQFFVGTGIEVRADQRIKFASHF